MLPLLAFEIPAFLIGLLFGSFLNVCISRLPYHESIAKPRSRCPRCQHPIRWYDNVPLVSWIILQRRCRDCKATIPWRYPLVELGMGLWALVVLSRWAALQMAKVSRLAGPTTDEYIALIALAILGFLLLGLIVMDWQTRSLPDAFTLTGIATGVFLICVQAIFLAPGEDDVKFDPSHSLRMSSPGSSVAKGNVFLTGTEHMVFGRVVAILAAAALPFLIRVIYKAVRGRQGMGLGDIKLMAMIAAFLGFWPAVFAFFLGCLFIFPYAVTLLIRKRADRATQLPFGSFLAAGGLASALFGPPIIDWYRSFL